jgi:hypothetical protein
MQTSRHTNYANFPSCNHDDCITVFPVQAVSRVGKRVENSKIRSKIWIILDLFRPGQSSKEAKGTNPVSTRTIPGAACTITSPRKLSTDPNNLQSRIFNCVLDYWQDKCSCACAGVERSLSVQKQRCAIS